MIRKLLVGGCVYGLALTLLAGCAIEPPADAGGGVRILPTAPPDEIAASGEVLGQGTVLQNDGAPPALCLGPIAESYPPQCAGPKIVGWDWAAVDGEENAGGVTWGTYAVQGTWDGQQFTVTAPPIMLALYDPMHTVDPHQDPANAGRTPEARLNEIQSELGTTTEVSVLSAGQMNGYIFVDVIHDDGQIQAYFDDLYGGEVVLVRSALRPVAP